MSGSDYHSEKRQEVAGNLKTDIPTVNVSINVERPLIQAQPGQQILADQRTLQAGQALQGAQISQTDRNQNIPPSNISTDVTNTNVSNESNQESLKDKAKDLKDNLKEKVKDVKDNIKESINENTRDVKDKKENVKEDVKDKKENVKENVRDVKENVKDKTENVKEDVKDKAENVKEDVKDKAENVKENVKEDVKDKAENVKENVRDVKDNAKEKAQDLKENVKEKANDVKDTLKEKANDVKDTLKEKTNEVQEKASDVKDTLKEKANEVTEKANEVTEKTKAKVETKINMRSLLKSALYCLEDFVNPKLAVEKQIPIRLLSNALGVVFLTEYKASFGIGSSMGTGLIVARTADRQGWTGPCAIGMGGFSIGFQVGLQKIQHVIVLRDEDVLKTFSSKGQLKLGGDISFAVGPLGRDAQISLNLSDKDYAPVYSYSMSKGLHIGASLEGQAIIIRDDCNEDYYGKKVSANDILFGKIDSLTNDNEYSSLVRLIDEYTQKGQLSQDWFTDENNRQYEDEEEYWEKPQKPLNTNLHENEYHVEHEKMDKTKDNKLETSSSSSHPINQDLFKNPAINTKDWETSRPLNTDINKNEQKLGHDTMDKKDKKLGVSASKVNENFTNVNEWEKPQNLSTGLNEQYTRTDFNEKPLSGTFNEKPLDISSEKPLITGFNEKPFNTFSEKPLDTFNEKPLDASSNKYMDTNFNKKPFDTTFNKPLDTDFNKKPLDTNYNEKPLDTTFNKPLDTDFNKKPLSTNFNEKSLGTNINEKPLSTPFKEEYGVSHEDNKDKKDTVTKLNVNAEDWEKSSQKPLSTDFNENISKSKHDTKLESDKSSKTKDILSNRNEQSIDTSNTEETDTNEKEYNMHRLLSHARRSLDHFVSPNLAIEKRIPSTILSGARAIIFLTEMKAGLVIGASFGRGIILARKQDSNEWTGPCAVSLGGMSVGWLAGAEKIDHILVLRESKVLQDFLSKGQLKFGGNLSFAMGPLGRDATISVNVNDKGYAPIYSYALSKGAYIGASLDGHFISIRDDVNEQYYGKKVKSSDILHGLVECPKDDDCKSLCELLDQHISENVQDTKDVNIKDFKDTKDIKEKDFNETKDFKDIKDRDFKDTKDVNVNVNVNDFRDIKDTKDFNDKDFKDVKETKDNKTKIIHEKSDVTRVVTDVPKDDELL